MFLSYDQETIDFEGLPLHKKLVPQEGIKLALDFDDQAALFCNCLVFVLPKQVQQLQLNTGWATEIDAETSALGL